MKAHSRCVVIALISGLALCGVKARATLEINASVRISTRWDFEAPLAAQGTWVEVRSYGRCWHPVGVAVDWRPYCAGEWLWTDCGWYWQSDEPWAWACYHYGSWVLDPVLGWVWVPGIEWAPAWVYWRTGGGYVGWAPCAPAGVAIAPASFAFVTVAQFHAPVRPGTVIVNNTALVSKTTVVNTPKHETRVIAGTPRPVVVNEGPAVASIQQATGKPVKTIPIQEAAGRTSTPSTLMRKPAQPAATGKASPAMRQPTPSPAPESAPPSTHKPAPSPASQSAPPSKGGSTPARHRHHRERVAPPADAGHPPAARPAPPQEPAGGNDSQKSKDEGHDKDKS